MKHLAAYLLLTAGGNENPTADSIKALLETVGIDAQEDRLESLINALQGKSIEDIIAKGKEKLASVPTGGAGVAASAGVTNGAAAEEEAKAEEKEEDKEESDEDMGFGLFD